MSSPTRYVKGDWKAVCDVCGFRFDASKLKTRWDGLKTCSNCFEERHPQDFVRAKVDIQAVPWTRPESEDSFVTPTTGGLLFFDSCDTATILSSYPTVDLGTTEIAGPAETAYTIPATEVTRNRIGITPCGQVLLETRTKTYSSRNALNQWKAFLSGGSGNEEVRGSDVVGYANSAWSAVNYPPENYLVGYGSTEAAARTAARDKLGGIGTYSITSGGFLFESVVESISDPTTSSRTYTGSRYRDSVLISGPGALLYTANSYNTSIQLTLYYLDVHEVWTYEFI